MGVVIAAANVNDAQLLEATIDARVFAAPGRLWTGPQNVCPDAGNDTVAAREMPGERESIPHIRLRRA